MCSNAKSEALQLSTYSIKSLKTNKNFTKKFKFLMHEIIQKIIQSFVQLDFGTYATAMWRRFFAPRSWFACMANPMNVN